MADTIYAALVASPTGLTRSQIHALFNRNRPEGEITRALNGLLEYGRVTFEKTESGGRPAELWKVCDVRNKRI